MAQPETPRVSFDVPPGFGVLLLNMGGPETSADVAPYLRALFADPDMIQLPWGGFGRGLLARWIARRRAPVARKRYERIGGGSPINAQTAAQAAALRERLGCPVTAAMRYCEPRIADALRVLRDQDVERIVAVSMHPQYSVTTTKSAVTDLKAHAGGVPYTVLDDHHAMPGFFRGLAELSDRTLSRFQGQPAPHLLFVAHSIPVSYTERGDPYIQHVEKTVELAASCLGTSVSWSLAYQSRLGPVKWHGPTLEKALSDLLRYGVRRLAVVPVSFTVENLETLFDLDIEFREQCLQAGISEYRRVPALAAHTGYMDGLAERIAAAMTAWEDTGNA